MRKITKYLAITPSVKKAVYKRDNGRCILCGREGLPEAHYIPRSKLGLGIEQNIVTLCRPCHRRLDQSVERKYLLSFVSHYLKVKYPNFEDKDRVYHK